MQYNRQKRLFAVLASACALLWLSLGSGDRLSAAEEAAMTTDSAEYSLLEELCLDLVVTRVMLERGDFPTGRTVKITPTVKNMGKGSYRGDISVELPELDTTILIQDGIGPEEEKAADPLYYCELSGCELGPFSVVVDKNNDIEEFNEENNICTGITFGPRETSRTHICAVHGPHCPDHADPNNND